MSLTTSDQRSAAIGFMKPYSPLYPVPDGSIDASDLQHFAYSYPSISATPADSTNVAFLESGLMLGIGKMMG